MTPFTIGRINRDYNWNYGISYCSGEFFVFCFKVITYKAWSTKTNKKGFYISWNKITGLRNVEF
jgi:hypothetical protein